MELTRAVAFALSPLIAAVATVLGVCIYRAIFHPLAKYPGPFLAKFTNLYSGYHAWKGDIHLDIYECHKKYGDHVRYAPNRLIFNTGPGLRDIHGHGAKVIKFKNYEILSRQAANLLTIRNKTVHAKRRRILSQAFSENNMRLFEPKIMTRVERFLDLLRLDQNSSLVKKDGWSEPIDMAHTFDNLAFDLMTSISFDTDFDTLRSPEYRYVVRAIEDSNVRLGVLLQAPEVGIGGIDNRLFPEALIARKKFVKVIRMILGKRLSAAKTPSKDIFSFLQQCKDPETGDELTTAELSTETATFIVAGADTSSASMAAVSHYLTGSSSSYRRAAEEVRNTFSSADEICMGAKLNSCAYLRACVDEALRLSPPGGSPLWREVETGGTVIDGHFIPEKCEVGVGIYSIHHSSLYYPNPFTYDPERWYRPEASKLLREESSKLPYMPFSVGPRSCIGKPLAIAQIMIVFARLFWEFDFRREDSQPGWEEQDLKPKEYLLKDHVTAWKEGPVLRFKSRN